jgi:hypothetical protein
MGWQEDQKAVATGVTDGTIKCGYDLAAINAAFDKEYANHKRNETLEEVAAEFDRMTSLGDTAASFAAFVRGMKS